jgi:hypothetical protein
MPSAVTASIGNPAVALKPKTKRLPENEITSDCSSYVLRLCQLMPPINGHPRTQRCFISTVHSWHVLILLDGADAIKLSVVIDRDHVLPPDCLNRSGTLAISFASKQKDST